jgi:hypothetical protein
LPNLLLTFQTEKTSTDESESDGEEVVNMPRSMNMEPQKQTSNVVDFNQESSKQNIQ